MGTKAPRIDLHFLKDIIKYEEVNKNLVTAILQTFLRHQWYLSEELIVFSFFDDEAAINDKQKMLKTLGKKKGGSTTCLKGVIIQRININYQLSLNYFV